MDLQVVGKKIRQQRKIKGLTQEELASAVSLSTMTIRRYESGERMITEDTIKLLAGALGVLPAYLQGWDDAMSALQAVGLSMKDIADEMGIPVDMILKIVNDKDAYSAEATDKLIRVASFLVKEFAHNTQKSGETVTFQPFTETDAKLIELGGFGAISEFYNLPEEAQKKALEDIRGFVEYVIDKYKKQSSEDK